MSILKRVLEILGYLLSTNGCGEYDWLKVQARINLFQKQELEVHLVSQSGRAGWGFCDTLWEKYLEILTVFIDGTWGERNSK